GICRRGTCGLFLDGKPRDEATPPSIGHFFNCDGSGGRCQENLRGLSAPRGIKGRAHPFFPFCRPPPPPDGGSRARQNAGAFALPPAFWRTRLRVAGGPALRQPPGLAFWTFLAGIFEEAR